MRIGKTKALKLLGVTLLLVLILATVSAEAAQPDIDYRPVDVGPELRTWEASQTRIMNSPADAKAAMQTAEAAVASADACVTDAKVFLGLDDYNGGYFFDTFLLMAETDNSQIWVQEDMSWPEGDPRDTPVVTCDQAAYLADQFDTNIEPTEETFFGPADELDGTNSLLEAWGYVPAGYYDDVNGRQIVLVENVRDDSFYDPTYPNYIAGFYSGSLEAYFDRNTMSIDSYDWENRTGPDARRPYLYESVFAHEFQHLLHDDYDSAEESWINEGLSMWAEPLCNYPVPEDYFPYVANYPENSLVVWGDQGGREILTDYGLAYMYQQYMYEQYGEDYIKQIFLDSANQGIASVDDYLAGEGTTFAQTYYDFSIGLYTGDLFELPELADFQVNVGHPGDPNPEAFATPGAPPWGADYILTWGSARIAQMEFNGLQFNPTPWTSDGDTLYSGTGDLVDNWLIFETTGGGTLSFDSYWDLEDFWDYGFVQVSTNGGASWTSLDGAYTTSDHDPGAHPKVIANLPGLTSWSKFLCPDGDPDACDGWFNLEYDLSAYPGDILVGFRMVTDWATHYEGWYVDNITVDGTLISDGSSTDPFNSLEEVLGIENKFVVTLIGERTRRGQVEYNAMKILDDGYQSDWVSIRAMFQNYHNVVIVVTAKSEQGVSAYTPYSLQIDNRGGRHLR